MPLTPITGAERGGGAGLPAGAAAARGAGVGGIGAAARATGAAGGAIGAGAAATGAAAAAAALGAGAGILIVGAAVGLGGKLIRTVSFFGWTLAGSVDLGGTAPDGMFGMLSAIKTVFRVKLELAPRGVKCLFEANWLQKRTGRRLTGPGQRRVEDSISSVRDDHHLRGRRGNRRRRRRRNEALALREVARC